MSIISGAGGSDCCAEKGLKKENKRCGSNTACARSCCFHVPYKGGRPQYTIDLITGRIDMVFASILEKLHAELVRILALADVKTQYGTGGLVARSNSPAEFSAFIRHEYDKWAKVLNAAGIRIE